MDLTVHSAVAGQRLLLLRMEPEAAIELAKLGGALAGGAVGLKLLDWFRTWRGRRQREPVELTAKILDDGDKLRELLLEEVKRLQGEKDAAIERAHIAEKALAVIEAEHKRLALRLERKDEQNKALLSQLIDSGLKPVVFDSHPVEPGKGTTP